MKYQNLIGRLCIALTVLLLAAACSAPPPDETASPSPLPPPPTAETAATEAVPPPATETTAANEPPPTVTPPETAVFEETAVPAATPGAAETADPAAPTALQILQPAPESEWTVGSDLRTAGTADAAASTTISVSLQAGPYTLASAALPAAAAWETGLAVPMSVSGPAEIVAIAAGETVTTPITLQPEIAPAADAPVITMTQPFPEQLAPPGYPLFFAGSMANAEAQTVTIAFWVDGCRELAAQQSFTVDAGTADWNGYLILPEDIEAEFGCAQAMIGTEGTSTWRTVLRRLPMLPPTDAAEEPAVRLTLGNPQQTPFTAGTAVTLFGAAVNAPEAELLIMWMGADGETMLTQGTVMTDTFGYWEFPASIPETAVGPSELVVQYGAGEEAIVQTFTLQIEE